MTHQNIFVRSVVIGATALSIAASLASVAQARGGRDHVDLKPAQEFAQPTKAEKFSLFGKRNATKKAAQRKLINKKAA